LASVKVAELKRREILLLAQVSIPFGENGYVEHPFQVLATKPQHNIFFTIRVLQPAGRTDLDIGFSVMDDDNYKRWKSKQPSSAFIIASRFSFGTLTFTPSNIGLYHAVLDNRYSVLTGKEVAFSIYETWIEEKEVEIPVPKPEEKVEKPKPKVGLLQRLINRFRPSQVLRVIGLLVAVQLICVFLAIGIAFLLHFTLGVSYGDTVGYIATAVGGSAVIILVYLYFLLTGRSLSQLSPPS
jgi:hypothetical protein